MRQSVCQRLAKEMLDSGALAVLGGHPHVVQPWEKHVTPDGRETFIIYSLGNFVSGQNGMAKRSSLILYVGLTKGEDGKVTINGPACPSRISRVGSGEDRGSCRVEGLHVKLGLFGQPAALSYGAGPAHAASLQAVRALVEEGMAARHVVA